MSGPWAMFQPSADSHRRAACSTMSSLRIMPSLACPLRRAQAQAQALKPPSRPPEADSAVQPPRLQVERYRVQQMAVPDVEERDDSAIENPSGVDSIGFLKHAGDAPGRLQLDEEIAALILRQPAGAAKKVLVKEVVITGRLPLQAQR